MDRWYTARRAHPDTPAEPQLVPKDGWLRRVLDWLADLLP
jgi:hypothetical protein